MRIKFLIALIAIFVPAVSGAQIDNRTKNLIKAKFKSVQSLHKEGKCTKALAKIEEIEELTKGGLLAATQDIKVSCHINLKQFKVAEKELYLLQGLNLPNRIINNLEKYSDAIEKEKRRLINAENEKKRLERQKLAEIERKKEEARLAQLNERRFIAKYDFNYDWSVSGLRRVGYGNQQLIINESGQIVIQPFPLVSDEPLRKDQKSFAVKTLNGWGIVDRNGDFIIKPQYEMAYSFNGELAPVKKGGYYGFVDKNNKLVVPFVYDDATYFVEGFSKVVRNGKVGFIDESGEVIVEPIYDDGRNESGILQVKSNGKWALISEEGERLTDFKYDGFISFYFEEDFIVVYILAKLNEKIEILRLDPIGVDEITVVHNAKFGSGILYIERDKNSFAYYDMEADKYIKIPDIVEDGTSFVQGSAIVLLENDEMALMNSDTNLISESYDSLNYHSLLDDYDSDSVDFSMIKACRNNLCGYINTSGKEVVPLKFDSLGMFSDGMVVAEKGDLNYLYNYKGELLAKHKWINPAWPSSKEPMHFFDSNRTGFLSNYGSIVFSNKGLIIRKGFEKGLATLSLPNGQLKYINIKGNIVSPNSPQYYYLD